ncbi:hypothetical protein H9623_09225 [Oerskovia sp. Sa1BUA8]|uniref:DUF4126 domain-containing protein n=1 Tax=Oerskovia douganii TaxID=2762210 RepID=A0A9D5U979_9CELL|nr:hypothetical protein [Oerskovia douganii]MBE7700483.1 hypothetical protein [Oerskovia douganii]
MTRAADAPYLSLDVLVRSVALGVAAGSRASLGLAAPILTSALPGPGGVTAKVAAGLGVAAELTGDKLPSAGSRLEPPGPAIRMASGALGGLALARRAGVGVLAPVVLGAVAAAVGTAGGAMWRLAASGWAPDWQLAVAEDAVALSSAAFAVRT